MSKWIIKKKLKKNKVKWPKWEKKKIFRDLEEKIGYKQWHVNFELSSSEYRLFMRGWKSPDPCVLFGQSQDQSKIGLIQQSTFYALYRNKSPCSKSLKENPSSGLGWLDPTSSDYSFLLLFGEIFFVVKIIH